MPVVITYQTSSVAYGAGMGRGSVQVGVNIAAHFNPDAPLALAPTLKNLIAQARAKVKATLPTMTQLPESLEAAQNLAPGKLPFLVLVATDAQDVSAQYPVFCIASQVAVDFVLVCEIAGDGVTDTFQEMRDTLQTLLDAFFADYHLGGLVDRVDVQRLPAKKQNEYEDLFAQQGQPVGVMVLSLAFTLVEDIPPAT